MNTIFKIFKIEGNISQLERFVKRYQEELRLEVKSVVVLGNYESETRLGNYKNETIIGVIFEKGSKYKESQNLKPDKYSYAYVEPGAH